MESTNKIIITVKTTVHAPVEKIWTFWTAPEHIVQWNNASDDWHTPFAVNDLKKGGAFSYRMEARDGSMGFDFAGVYNEITIHRKIVYTIADGRTVEVLFSSNGPSTQVVEAFEAENMNPIEMQRYGWQAILDNFKKYVEENITAHA